MNRPIVIKDAKVTATPFGSLCEFLRASNESFSVAHLTINPAKSTPQQTHQRTTKVIIVRKGYVRLYLGDQVHVMGAGSVCEVPIGIQNSMFGSGAVPAEVEVICSPAFDPNNN